MLKNIFVIFAVLVALLIGGSFLGNRFQKFTTNLVQNIELPLSSPLSQEGTFKNALPQQEAKQFTSNDGSVRFSYPGDWSQVPTQTTGLPAVQEYAGYKSRVIFFAQKFTIDGAFARLIVSEITGEAKTPEQILEAMQQSNSQEGWEMKVAHVEKIDGALVFEATYTSGSDILHTKEKILLLSTPAQEQKIFTVTILTPQTHWEKFEGDAGFIVDSAKTLI